MRAGDLNRQVTLEAPSDSVAAGEATLTWPVQATVWARMEGLSGLDRSGLTAEVEYRFRLRYRSDVTPRWRLGLVGTTRKFGVVSAIDPDGRRTELVILARELI